MTTDNEETRRKSAYDLGFKDGLKRAAEIAEMYGQKPPAVVKRNALRGDEYNADMLGSVRDEERGERIAAEEIRKAILMEAGTP